MDLSLSTPKCTLVPSNFFDAGSAREALAAVVELDEDDEVKSVEVPQYGAYLIYVSGKGCETLPEMFFLLKDLPSCKEYNKILCSHADGWLHIAIAQGGSLLLANSYRAPDFTTAEYFIFLAVKSLQINPEISTIYFRTPLGAEDEISLYKYFKSVDTL